MRQCARFGVNRLGYGDGKGDSGHSDLVSLLAEGSVKAQCITLWGRREGEGDEGL